MPANKPCPFRKFHDRRDRRRMIQRGRRPAGVAPDARRTWREPVSVNSRTGLRSTETIATIDRSQKPAPQEPKCQKLRTRDWGHPSLTLTPGLVPYSATKGAVKMFTQGPSREVGTRGITVNNIQPGPIDTDLNPAAAIRQSPRRPTQRSTATDLLTKLPRWSRLWLVRRRRTSPVRT
jgi:NAD(P)-dependent dehydrogenase (short-subunit alcohol dehydrogenase family)